MEGIPVWHQRCAQFKVDQLGAVRRACVAINCVVSLPASSSNEEKKHTSKHTHQNSSADFKQFHARTRTCQHLQLPMIGMKYDNKWQVYTRVNWFKPEAAQVFSVSTSSTRAQSQFRTMSFRLCRKKGDENCWNAILLTLLGQQASQSRSPLYVPNPTAIGGLWGLQAFERQISAKNYTVQFARKASERFPQTRHNVPWWHILVFWWSHELEKN